MEPRHGAAYDLLLSGGEVLDASQGLRGVRDVAFAYGRVAAVQPAGSIDPSTARTAVDAIGKLVTPGLIDLHTHVYVGGSELVIPPDEVCSVSGCTTVVDLGTAGANTMMGLYRMAQRDTRTRVYAFVHISSIGLAGHPHGESRDLVYVDPQLAARCVLSYPGFVLGIKVRQTAGLVGQNGLEPLRRAVQAAGIAEEVIHHQEAALQTEEPPQAAASRGAGQPARSARRVPVAVHIGGAPAPIGELLALLGPGDVVTHCFTGTGNGLVGQHGALEPAVLEARQRGVRFDVGHGRGSFSYPVAKAAAEGGFWPDTISTDLHSASVNSPVVDMPTTMSKFLDLGMPLEEVVRRSTQAPGAFINGALPVNAREPLLGTLQVGAPGDAAVLSLERGDFTVRDSLGYSWQTTRMLVPRHTVLGGRLWGRPYPHPYLMP